MASPPLRSADLGTVTGAAGLDPETVKRARILIVDDQRPNVRLLERLLAKFGYQHIRSTTDSRNALAEYLEFQPDLVLLDLHMPEIDGFGVMEQLRAHIPDGTYLPILVLTADVEDGARRRALAGGAHDFLVKPLDPSEVWLRIANLLRTRFLHLELARHNLLLEDLVVQRTEQLEGARLEMIDILDVANEAFVGMDGTGRITAWNRQAEVTFGWPREEALGRNMAETIIPQQRADYEAGLARSLAGDEASILGQRVEISAVDRYGREFPIEMVVWPVGGGAGGESFHAFIHDISERRYADEAVRAARDHALDASKLKSQFLANISHEIRTPMNGVLGMAHLLLDTDLDDTQRRFLGVLRQSGQELMAIIDQILDFSGADTGKLELELIDFELRAMVDGAVSHLTPRADDKGLTLALDISSDAPTWVRGDPVRLRQIITNLVGNAIKFTNSGRVDVRVTATTDGRVRFETTDTGIGIDASARRWLLDPFSQADGSATRRFGGTGLGLAICNQLVKLMGGVLDYHSQPGNGSAFWFEVPLETGAPPQVGQSPPVPPEVATADKAADSDAETLPAGGRILLVDDSEMNQLVVTALLERWGYQVDVSPNGAHALDALRTTRYDLILMDCLMSVMDGYETTAHIRRQGEPGRHIPIIALDALATADNREKCLAAGMDDYVSQPLDPAALKEALARCCSR